MSGSINLSPFGENAGAPFDCAIVRRAIEQLPREEREALLLHWMHGLEYDEIAHKLSLPVPRVEALIADARRALRTQIADASISSGALRA